MAPHPYGPGAPVSGWASDAGSGASPCSQVDGLLAGAGYRVRSSDLGHVARSLERLESVMVSGDGVWTHPAAASHCNPSDITAWVDSMLSELSPDNPPSPPLPAPIADKWMDPTTLLLPQQSPALVAAQRMAEEEEEEGSGIRLVHLLMSCAEAVQRGDARLAGTLIEEMRFILARVSTAFGIGKVAGYFVDALFRRVFSSDSIAAGESPAEREILYQHFYEACPYLKFAHFTANQAILEALEGHDRVHVVDFDLMHGLQWPALIQALALRRGGPPSLRLTGIGPPSPDGRDALREVGLRLAELARSVRVRFAFRGVAAVRLADVQPWMLHVAPGEALAVNSVLQLHRLLDDPPAAGAGNDMSPAPIDGVLEWVVGLRPLIVTVVEQEADHNKPGFLDRFTDALFYYSTMFDSLGGGGGGGRSQQQAAAVAEVYLQREICNIVCCEGAARRERHEPLSRWRARLGGAGLRPVHLGSNAFKQASMLLTLFSGEGYGVEEVDGCLKLGWHSRPLFFASAWRADDDMMPPPPPPPPDGIVPSNHGNNSNLHLINYTSSISSDSNYNKNNSSNSSVNSSNLQRR